MSEARLRSLRLVGFKSFAERTVVEFGPGISAIIGPNGSGKSNLADALRWVLGEQGRSLRTRRAEDLIFAGSSRRRAVGMADVTLTLDNGDRLLPVDYAEIELGRRLFRSGENEFLLNRQRVRLRDLVDLLDEANLADNAFLFIGQGMVDQALALRPEERRPLFEEAAGTRKHERRRRAAEAALTEAEANLERVRDLLAELRPQARRLAAQVEQQQQRRSAGRDLADALVAAARGRLGGAEREALRLAKALEEANRDADASLSDLRDAEAVVGALAAAGAERSAAEREARARLDTARSRAMELRLAASQLAGALAASQRDRERVDAELAAVRSRAEAAGRELAVPAPDMDDELSRAAADVERRVSAAEAELAALREAGLADERRSRLLRDAREAHAGELERARRRAADATRRLRAQEGAAGAAAELAGRLATERDAATRASHAGSDEEAAAEVALESARARLVEADAVASRLAERAASVGVEAAAAAARLAAIEVALGARDGIDLGAPTARPALRLIEGLEIEPALRRSVEAVLGEALAAIVVPSAEVAPLTGRALAFVVAEAAEARPGRTRDASAVAERAAAAGGGPLTDAVRRDPTGHARRLLGRAVWVPTLELALSIRTDLPPGWVVATPAGTVVTDLGLVRPGAEASVLELRAQHEESARVRQALEADAAAMNEDLANSRAATDAARASVAVGRDRLDAARRARRVAEESERAAVRGEAAAARDMDWTASLLERLRGEAAAAADGLAARDREAEAWRQDDGRSGGPDDRSGSIGALATRVTELSRERDGRRAAADDASRRREAILEARRRAEVRLALDTARDAELERERAEHVAAAADLAGRRGRIDEDLAGAAAAERDEATVLAALEEAGQEDGVRSAAAAGAVSAARRRHAAADARARAAEVGAMEVRLQLDAGREALLVELAAIGADGLAALTAETCLEEGAPPPPASGAGSGAEEEPDLTVSLEAGLSAAMAWWRSSTEDADDVAPPTTARLAALRRRYHDLGVGNPFADAELAEVSQRLGVLEAQRSDLESAIRSTRELMERLDRLISEQFRATFAALEGAFARSFTQLFGGGDAQLALTAPDDLAATGVEITARPPGKKRQPLAMLSGGERALTAVALLLAMLEVRPVPFCVLDEVDAALDEANVGRFSAALRDLAQTIQFVVITHNRGTIEAADALYGVTVGDDAVSRVVSLRLADVADVDPSLAVPPREAVALPVGPELGPELESASASASARLAP